MKKWSRYIFCFVLVAVVLLVYELRLFQWQFVESDRYSQISDSTSSFFIKLNGARGEILDRNGKTLAGNRTTYNVVMNALTMENDRNLSIMKILRLLQEYQIPWVDKLPIVLDETGAYVFAKDQESEIAYLKSPEMLGMQDYATAEECMAALIERYDCKNFTREESRNVISVRYYMTKSQFSRSEPYVIAEDVPLTFVQVISERQKMLPGIETRVSTAREYGDGTAAPHIIGTLGAITQEQYDAHAAAGEDYSSENLSGYTYTETVGQSGIEEAFESTLRGKNGKEAIVTDNTGAITKTEVEISPTPGNNVYLTLDRDLQRVANESLARNIKASTKTDCIAGAAVVLDMKTFGVLAAATYPTFDISEYVKDDKYYTELLKDETKPLFNRALDGVFTPGSVMKPCVGLAALEEGVIDTNFTFNCNGNYTYYEDAPLHCLAPGTWNIYTALQHSCNSFFCDVGRRLTIEKMEVYANLLSLGERTGVELSESAGSMSNPEEYKKNHGVDWVDGVTIQAAIGQADSMFTPIQLATYCATIGNDGLRYKTHFLEKITDYDRVRVVEEYRPQIAEKLEVQQKNLDVIQEGMRMVCQDDGNAAQTFSDYGIAVAAKTGTAENPGHSDNTVFMAYAPYDKPEIAVAVVLEYGAAGALSQGVAKDIFDCYFFGKTLEQKAADAKAADGEKSEE